MATLNVKIKSNLLTYEGAPAKIISPELQLRRSVMSCLLWENTFYEDGVSVANRIIENIKLVKPEVVAQIAIEAREKFKLRHIPLLIVREMARLNTHKHLVADTLERIIQRPDELTEFLAIYWENGKCPISSQVKKGLAKAFTKFNEYSLAKYNRDKKIKLKDVMFLTHPKPLNDEQTEMWKRLVNDELKIPDTWEVELSAGKDKKEVWERLLVEDKLGSLALLRNLRNMISVNVDMKLIKEAILKMKTERVLPFRFIAAARYAPELEPELELAMFNCLLEFEKLIGKTILLIDVSGSMDLEMSGKSDLTRLDAACGVGMLLREICEDVEIYTFSDNIVKVPPRRGFALRDAIVNSQEHSATYLGEAIKIIDTNINYERLIVITDEQSHDKVSDSKGRGYMINVAPYKNGVGYGKWIHIDGFSENIISWILEYEKS